MHTGIVYSIAFVSVALRIAGKFILQRLAWNDAVVVAALLLTAIPVACVLQMALHGFGQHLWDLEDGKLKPILLYCKRAHDSTLGHLHTDRCSIRFMVHVRRCTLYDQSISGTVLHGDLQDTPISKISLHLPCLYDTQQLNHSVYCDFRLQTSKFFLEPRHQRRMH